MLITFHYSVDELILDVDKSCVH